MPPYYPSPPASDAEDIELAPLQNEHKADDDDGRLLPPKYDRNKWEHNQDAGSDDEDDFHSHTDDGNRALLGVQGKAEEVYKTGWISRVKQTWPNVKSLVTESAPILLLTTIGLLFTGKLLDELSQWRAMREVNQLIIIVPVVLNLKGNLEMNLSARLGTAANVGELDEPTHRWSLIRGNLILLQVQATAVSFVAACMSLLLGLMTAGEQEDLVVAAQNATATLLGSNSTSSFARSETWHLASLAARKPLPNLLNTPGMRSGIDTFVIVTATATLAACLSSCLLGSLMCAIIVLCRRFGYDPDNIAPPAASCLGDLLTLCLMGVVSSAIIPYVETPLPLFMATLLLVSTFACLLSAFRNPHIRPLLSQGWAPLFGAMIISSVTGMVLDLFVTKYEDFAILAIVISGLPGSVGAIFVSRISTSLHAAALSASRALSSPDSTAAFSLPQPVGDKTVMFTLLLVTIPVEIVFLTILELFGWLETPFMFVGLSLVFFCIAVFLSLLIGRWLTHTLWSWKRDPDMYALPLHSALMDLVGQGLLVLCFEIASVLGAQVTLKPSS